MSVTATAEDRLWGALVTHEEGNPTQRAQFREMARKLVYDPKYQAKLLEDFRARKVSPAVERLFWEAAHCSVKVDEGRGAEESTVAEAMRASVKELAESNQALELDAKAMGARRVLTLPPNAVRRVRDDDESA